MTRLALIRHGPTAWNAAGRLQGRSDTALSPAGHAELAARGDGGLNPRLAGYYWLASPLRRARLTATLLCGFAPPLEPRLIEMDWGDWEGRTLAEIRAEIGPALQRNEDRGLDFRPPNGESPRDVQDRLRPWLAELAAQRPAVVAVSHKGVIRALMAGAYQWDMMVRAPVKLDWARAHIFDIAADGGLTPVEMNVAINDPGKAAP
jgi:probable phosphoglycerate mutase